MCLFNFWKFVDGLVGEGAPNEEKEAASSGRVGANDLLIVGPGVLGRLVAQKWREVFFVSWSLCDYFRDTVLRLCLV